MSLEHSTTKQMLRPREVVKRVGLSRTTLWRMVKSGNFPPPVVLGQNSIGWRSGDIEIWEANRPRRTYGAELADQVTT